MASNATTPGEASNQFANDVSFEFDDLWSLTLGTLLYGIYFVLFLLSTYLFAARQTRQSRRSSAIWTAFKAPIFAASWCLFVAISIVWILTVQRTFEGSLTQPSETIQNTFIELSLAIGDGMILYRLWAIWRRWTVIIPPFLCFVGLVVTETISVVDTALGSLDIVENTITASVAFTLATNIYCTIFIWYGVWRVTSAAKSVRVVRPAGHLKLTRVVAIFVESAAGFTAYFLLYAILHLRNLKIQFGFINSVPAAIGIANALITARVALAKKENQQDAEMQHQGRRTDKTTLRFASSTSGGETRETETTLDLGALESSLGTSTTRTMGTEGEDKVETTETSRREAFFAPTARVALPQWAPPSTSAPFIIERIRRLTAPPNLLGHCLNPHLRTTVLLACTIGLLALLFLQETTITRWAGRLSPQLSVYTTNFSQYPQDIVWLDGESDVAETINVAALSRILFPSKVDADDHTLFAENERMLRRLFECVEQGNCGRNQTKIVILSSGPFRGALRGDNGGEAIWANSTLIALRSLGYSYLYTTGLSQTVSLYQIFGNMVPIVIVDGSNSHKCFKDDNCVRRENHPHGVPIWKMLSFHFWDSAEHPLGRKWTLNPEPYRPEPDNNTYLGYSIEPQCSRHTFVASEDRRHQGYVLAKNAKYFEPEESSWATDAFARAAISVEQSTNTTFQFLAGVHEEILPNYWPAYVTNGGLLPQPKFYEALAHSKVLIGVGHPAISPTPYDALCLGVPFINPILSWDTVNPGDKARWNSQHNTLKHFEAPYVYNIFKGDTEGFVRAVDEAVRNPISSFVLPTMTMGAVVERLGRILETDWRHEAEMLLEERKKTGKGEKFWI
ncbi:hypothetical protein MIND_00803700 [Mycena indigotica]|uniref:alpha-1,6-mannosyl-glycoprotein 6-beta-N-acetylglucosaminyltransferase n=1 Tax=Mycena indigotica TaxID=2126181 RepID=A0A8H6SIP8_9AGAR|nr:uncharacterized protein MIND_00803700 [Mycena indigotica]KAF7298570.1 hypothetical protein MIND_00803700 [Mycena indigotica]